MSTWRGADEPDVYDEVITVCGVENFETAGLLTAELQRIRSGK